MLRKMCLIAVFALIGCSDDKGSNNANSTPNNTNNTNDMQVDLADGELQARTREGSWLGGDFHVHATGASNDTGGDSTPERIKEVAIERGLDFVVLTDHSNSTGSDVTTTDEDPDLFNMGPEFPFWQRVAMLTDETFLMIDGNEMSPVEEGEVPTQPTGHIGCYPRDLETFDPNISFTDRPRGTVDSANIVGQARDAGCFVTLNHPFGPAPWVAFDWTTYDYDAIEIYNGSLGWDTFDYQAMQAYLCDVSLGRDVTALGGSDNHRVNIEPPGDLSNPPLGWPTIYVFASDFSWPSIIEGMDNGMTSVSDTGAPLELDFFGADGTWLGMPGDEVDAAQTTQFRLRGTLANTDKDRVLWVLEVAPDSCDDKREVGRIFYPEVAWNVVFETTLDEQGEFEFVEEFEAKPGHAYIAWLRPERDTVSLENGIAFTGVIRTR